MKKDEVDVIVMVGGSTRIPKIKELVSEFFDGRKLETGVNPDEAIAFGAAIQAAVINGDPSLGKVFVMDVTPLSLGIETVGGVMSKIIHRNTPVPTEKFDIFTTTEDYQTQLVIPIYEGERPLTKFNRLLGELSLTDIPPAKKGYPQIKVSFKLDKNAVLTVTAEDMATKNKREVEIKKGFLSAAEIALITQDALKFADEDAEQKRATEAKGRLETYLDTIKSQLANKNIANRIKSQDKKKIMEERGKVEEWLKTIDVPVRKEIFDKLVSLKKIVQPILAKLTGEQIEEFPVEEEKKEDTKPTKEEKNTIEVGKDEL